MAERVCLVLLLGLVEYSQAWALQRALAQRRAQGAIGDVLLLLEHPHVYTIGRRGAEAEVLLPSETLARRGVQVYHVDRGGMATYHGPGQLVGYPILDLRAWGQGPVWYVRTLEAALIETLRGFGVPACAVGGFTGVWVPKWGQEPGGREQEPGATGQESEVRDRRVDASDWPLAARKIAAIGVRISGGVTTHGFALNVDPHLSYFRGIVPCGLPGLEVTSLALELGRVVDITDTTRPLVEALGRRLGLAMRWLGAAEWRELLGPLLPAAPVA